MIKNFRSALVTLGLALFLTSNAFAADVACKDAGKTLAVMNEQALQWKSQRSGFKSRAFISGKIAKVYKDQTGHKHFSIVIGAHNDDTIEVIYNNSFGQMPALKVGDEAEACGDFIVASKQNGGFPPSPDGAIVHWVHKSTRSGHDDGFVVINGTLYGFSGNGNRH